MPQVPWDTRHKEWKKIVLYGHDRSSATDVKNWCAGQIGRSWMMHVVSYGRPGYIVYRFESPVDAFSFKMRWHRPRGQL